jgi:predicted pyridoxine 5'-phosphate oxidase superfamily flavin-nucleotide-binding protein
MLNPDPFHPGERLVQERAAVRVPGAPIRDFMPDQHRDFFAGLPALFVGVAGHDGAPVATALAGPPGFLHTPDATHLAIAATPGDGDPAGDALRPGALVGLLGLEFATRRRNRANGVLATRDQGGLVVDVLQSFGNCPKYIHPRIPQPGAEPGPAQALSGLDDPARALIGGADTFFIATSSGPAGGEKGGVDMSHRGGPAGFVQVDEDRLTIPDFRGNRYFNSFGNLVLDDRAGLLFLDFPTGGLLHLQGRVTLEWGEAGVRSWSVDVERAWWRPGALGMGWA